MRQLAQQMNPANPMLGQWEVIRMMDAGVSLSRHFGLELDSLLPMTISKKLVVKDFELLRAAK